MQTFYSRMPSPIGELLLLADAQALTGLYMADHAGFHAPSADRIEDDAALADTRAQLTAYFAGELRQFDLPLAPRGTAFQNRVWQALRDIDYGATESYGALARRLGNARASRAVGLANGRNPISIIIPCHRVIGANGQLTGYGGGIERKRWLLTHEQRGVSARPDVTAAAG